MTDDLAALIAAFRRDRTCLCGAPAALGFGGCRRCFDASQPKDAAMAEREIDEDERREAIDARRERAGQRCVCGDNLPGSCPGRQYCPYSGDNEEAANDA